MFVDSIGLSKKSEKSGHSKSCIGLSASIPDLGQLTVGIFAFSCVLEKEK